MNLELDCDQAYQLLGCIVSRHQMEYYARYDCKFCGWRIVSPNNETMSKTAHSDTCIVPKLQDIAKGHKRKR